MSHIVRLEKVLREAEYRSIDDFCRQHHSAERLPEIAAFLEQEFGLKLALDPDIISGYAADSSNLPAQAQALARPTNEREVGSVAGQ